MQQQDISSLQVMREPAEHNIGAATDGIETAPCPARETQIEARQHRLQEWIAKACGRAEESWELTGCAADGLLRALDFVLQGAGAEEREVMHMSLAVILDHVTAVHDLTRELGVALDSLTDAEEARLDTILIQQRQHARSDFGLRPVIDGDCNRSASRRRRRQVGPVGAE